MDTTSRLRGFFRQLLIERNLGHLLIDAAAPVASRSRYLILIGGVCEHKKPVFPAVFEWRRPFAYAPSSILLYHSLPGVTEDQAQAEARRSFRAMLKLPEKYVGPYAARLLRSWDVLLYDTQADRAITFSQALGDDHAERYGVLYDKIRVTKDLLIKWKVILPDEIRIAPDLATCQYCWYFAECREEWGEGKVNDEAVACTNFYPKSKNTPQLRMPNDAEMTKQWGEGNY